MGSSSETSVSSILPWINKTSRKKELGAVLHGPAISLENRAVGTIVGRVPAAMLVSRLFASFCQLIRVHARVGDVDKGVHRDRGAALVGQATGATMVLGPHDAGAILRGAEACRDPRALEFVCAVLADVGRGTLGATRKDLFLDGSTMRCRMPS